MKKYILALITLLLIVTGCSKSRTMVCTRKTETDTKLTMNSTVTITYNDKKIEEIESVTVSDLSQTSYNTDKFINTLIESSKQDSKKINELKGVSVTYEKVANGFKYTLTVDYDKLKEDEIKEYSDTLYGKKDNKLEDFRIKFLSDYTCKEKK